MRYPRWLWLLAVLPSCSSDRGGGEIAGVGAQGYISDLFVVGDVVIDPSTYHWVEPDLLLTASEGAGPRTLNVAVSSAVTPHVSYTGTRSPSHSEISAALGWDVGQTVQLSADSSVLVPVNAYARVAAYPLFQKATWDVVGPGHVRVGAGAAYKPIGIYFDTCGCIGPDPCGAGCVSGFPYGAGPGAGAGGAAAAPDAPDGGADGGDGG